MPIADACVSIHPYFKVHEGKLEAFRDLCERFVAKTRPEPKCFYYGFTFRGDEVHCREAYDDAEGLLAHLDNVGALLGEAATIAAITRLEIHGAEEQLAKLRGPLGHLNPEFFTLEYGFRR